jgi:hypothetical protein
VGCLSLLAPRSSLLAQLPHYSPATLAGASYTEIIQTSVVSRTGTAEVRRSIARTARFGVSVSGDTVIVSADSLDLSESSGAETRRFDAGGLLGGRWKLMLARNGAPAVLTRPFVPDDIAEVSDVASAMEDFFPRTPPPMAVNAVSIDSARTRWERLPDSAGVQRFHWNLTRQRQGVQTVADTVPLTLRESSRESGELAWRSTGVPLAWTRTIHTEVTSTVRGRTVQSVVEQRIVVRRG